MEWCSQKCNFHFFLKLIIILDKFKFQTGPKGVIQDWQRFKQLEREKTAESEKEKKQLLKRLAVTCKTDLDGNDLQKNDKKPVAQSSVDDDIEREFMNDEFFETYLKDTIQKMQKLMNKT